VFLFGGHAGMSPFQALFFFRGRKADRGARWLSWKGPAAAGGSNEVSGSRWRDGMVSAEPLGED